MLLDDLEGGAVRVCEHPDRLDDAERRARADGAQVLRAGWPDPDYEMLRRAGFVVRPDWIMWVIPIPAGTASLLAAQTGTQRNRTRAAMRAFTGFQRDVHDPVTAGPYDEWLQLYGAQIDAMRGINIASQLRDDVLAPGSQHFLITWRDNLGVLVCGAVGRRDLKHSLLHVRFVAVSSPPPVRNTTRAVYAVLADLARTGGLSTLSAGIDANFYGAWLKPGLCLFKLSLGMLPVAMSALGDQDAGLVADKVLDVSGLAQPVLCFEQVPPVGREPAAPAANLDAAAAQLRLVGFVSVGFDQTSVPELSRMQVRLVG
jgi:hypothetical protein